MDEFCDNPSLKSYNKLDDKIKKILIEYSQKIIDNKLSGNKRLANRIIKYHYKIPIHITLDELKINHNKWRSSIKEDKYYYDIVKKDTIVFRGSGKNLELQKDKPTYFALEYYDSTTYINFGTRLKKDNKSKDNFLVGLVTKPLKLFKLDSLENINYLLMESFQNNKDLYEAIIRMFMRESTIFKYRMHTNLKPSSELSQIETKTRPFLFNHLYRVSVAKYDFIFVNWLCQNGFNGYSTGILDTIDFPSGKVSEFHAEMVICDPLSFIQIIDTINITKPKDTIALQNILIKLQKNKKIYPYLSSI